MRSNYIIILLLMVFNFGFSSTTEKPFALSATITGGSTVCQNATNVLVTFTGSGGAAPYTFVYKINGGADLSVVTTGTNSAVNVVVNSSNSGTFNYSLVSVTDSSDPSTTQNVSGNTVYTILQQADATINSSAESGVFGGFQVFKICDNQPSEFQFFNASTTTATNVTYTINWGDGTANFTGTNWNVLNHTYQVGLWSLVYTITRQNGCNITKTYKVFVGNNPAVGLENPGNTDICQTQSLTFPITGTENNPPGTIYIVSFNDGSPNISFNHPPPASVTHTFIKSSCLTTSSAGNTVYANSFFASIQASNPCDQSSASVVPIRISTVPVPNFTSSTNVVCLGSQICLTNSSLGGETATTTNCVPAKLIWNITPSIGYTLASGSLGNDLGITNTNAWISGTASICPIFTIPGTYTITLKTGNKCGIDEITKTICVLGPLTPAYTLNTNSGCAPLAITTTNATVLTNQCDTPTYKWEVTHAAGFCSTSNPTFPNQTTVNASYNFTEAGTYTIKFTTTNSCGSVSTFKTVEVKKPPVISINAIADACMNGTITPTANIPACAIASGTVSYAWSFPNGTPASSSNANPGNISYLAAGTYTVSLVVTNECGASNTATKTVVINPTPTITNTVLAQTICSGTATTPITLTSIPTGATFSWTAVATVGISGFTTSGTQSTIPAQTITTTNANSGTVTYTITPKIGNCTGASVAYVITVVPAPTITTQPAPSTVCLNGAANALTVVVNSSSATPTYQWYSNTINSNTGGTTIPGATSATFNPPTNVVGDIYYYCSIILPSGGCSGLTSVVAFVKVLALPTITTQPIASQNICVGVSIANPLTVIAAGGTGTASYQWYSSSSNATTGGNAIAAATSATYSPPVFTVPGNFYYYVIITYSGTNCGNVISQSAVINVFADPTTSQPLIAQTLCQGATPAILEVIATGETGNGTFNYQWFTNLSNNNTSGTAIPGATNATYIPPTTTVGIRYYYCIITQSTLGCNVTSNTATVVVNQSPSANISPISSTACLGGTLNPLTISQSNGVGTATYQWYSNTIANTSNGMLLVGETNATFTPPTSTVGSLFYYCSVTFSGITGSCAIIQTNTSEVIIIPAAVINVQPLASQNLCVGTAIATPLTVQFSGGTGAVTYEWFTNLTNSTTGGIAIPSSNSSSYTPPIFNAAGTFYYYVKISLSGSGCGAISSSVAKITVDNDPTISTQPIASQILCQSAIASTLEVIPTGGNGTFNYQWYRNSSNSTSGGILISGATNASYIPPTTAVGTIYYYCVITQTTLGCNVTSNTAAVIVNQSPSAVIVPSSSTACLGGNSSILALMIINGAGTSSYQWFSNTIDDTTTGMPLVGETNATFTPPTTAIGTLFYYCSVTFSGIIGSCSMVLTNTSEITVTPTATITQNPLPTQNLCVGATIANPLTVSYSGGTGTVSYQWFSTSSSDTSTGSAIVGATAANFTPPVFNTPGSFYFYVEITLSGNGCGAIKSNAAEIIIVNDPTITVQPLALQTLCQNATPTTLSVTPLGGIGIQYFYQWYSSATNITTGGTLISGATSSSFVPLTNIVGTVFYYCIITQEAGSGCNVTSAAAQVIINTAPAINLQPQANTYCVNQTATPLTVSYINGTGTPTYQWFSSVTNTNSGGLLLVGQTNNSLTPSTNIAENLYYYCVITFSELVGGCEIINSNAALITVNPFAIIASENATICSNNSFSIIPTDGNGNIVPTGTTYTWSQPIISPAGSLTGFSAQTIPQTEISQFLTNTTTSPATATYTVTPTSGICVGTNFTVTITVNPSINPNVVVSNNACFGVNNASISTNITGGIPPYSISWLGPNGFTSSATTISNIEPGTYTITIDDIGNCPFTQSYTITQPDDIVIITNSQTNNTCFQSNDATIDLSITGGTGDYNYSWTKNNIYFASTQDLSNLSPGIYIVTVSDENNCGPKTETFTITEPPLLVVSLLNQTNIDCFGASTGKINIEVVGGTKANDYNFAWTGPNGFTSTSQNLTTLVSGTYNVTVTDDNGCQKTLEVTLSQSTEIIITFATTEITCYGANDASLSTTITGGNGPYTFTWNNLSTVLNQTNVAAGDYIITVTDNLGCIKSATINIPEAPIFTVYPVVKNVSCYGANNGSIALNLVGGIAPVTLTWNDGSTAGLTRNNLAPGTYIATITDGKPCLIVRTFIIVQPQPLVLSANLLNPTNCTNPNSGSIDLMVSGGTAPFTYSWSNGVSTEDLNNVLAGNYAVAVIDANGCTASAQYSLVRPEPITIDVKTQTDFDCSTHQVTQNFLAQASGGVPPFVYQWSSGNVSGGNGQIMNTETNGTVLLTVYDSLGCSQIYTVNVQNPVIGYASFETISTSYTSYGLYSINDPIQFTSSITGDYESMYWDFGDGTYSSELNPIHTYTIEKNYLVTQTVTYPFGCVYKYNVTLSIEKGYILVLPTGFTPNEDALNDKFRPVTKNLKNIVMDIYDSWGSLIYSEKGNVIKGWDGKIKGFNAENGNYYSKVAAETFYGTTIYENQTFVLIK